MRWSGWRPEDERRAPGRRLGGLESDEQFGAALGIGDEPTVRGWLTPFDNALDRGHPLTWQSAPSPLNGATD